MPDFLKTPFANGLAISAVEVLIRLLAALVLGAAVAVVYRRTRPAADITPSFPATLVLLPILIAMVTLVIGESTARAFSLVGALSIVRFRTVVKQTEDTAYVILGVVLGMAAGINNMWVAVIGFGIVTLAAFVMVRQTDVTAKTVSPFTLTVRVSLGQDVDELLGPALKKFVSNRRLLSVATSKKGTSLDVSYETQLVSEDLADKLVTALNRLDGVQSVEIERRQTGEES